MKKIYLLALLLLPIWSIAQDSTALYFAKQISIKKLKEDLYELASDKMEGRETGKKGQKLAAQYIYHQLKAANIKNYNNSTDSLSYFQQFNLYRNQPAVASINCSDLHFKSNSDFYITSYKNSINENLDVILLHPDSTYSDSFLKGKAILFFTKNLREGSAKAFQFLYKNKCSAVFYCNPYLTKQYYSQVHFFKNISENRIFLYPKPEAKLPNSTPKKEFFRKMITSYREVMKSSTSAVIHPKMAAKLLNISLKELQKLAKGKKIKTTIRSPFQIKLNNSRSKKNIETENVIAMIKSDYESDEYITITAHYDHMGKNSSGIYHGANDNASGTATIIEVARQLRNAQKAGVKFKKNILFASFVAEEQGILGSKYFVQNPIIDLKKINANLNVDMVGRIDKKHRNSNYIYMVGTSDLNPKLKQISDSINAVYPNLKLDYRHDHKNNWLYRASDQSSFVSHNIPAIFYTNGLHDDYHKPSDTADKIDYKALKKVAELVFLTTWNLVQN
jgi:hypothetical protein